MTRFLVTGASGLLGLNFGMQMAAQYDVVGVKDLDETRHVGTLEVVGQPDIHIEGGNGVRVRDLRKACGFEAVFGPVRAEDLPRYLDRGEDEAMQQKTLADIAAFETVLSERIKALAGSGQVLACGPEPMLKVVRKYMP